MAYRYNVTDDVTTLWQVIGEVMAYCRKDGEEPCLGHDLEYLIMHDSIAVKTPSDELSPEEEARTYQFLMQRCKSEGEILSPHTGFNDNVV